MYENLKGKKLLIIGSEQVDSNIVEAAKSLGIYTVVVDGHKKSNSTFAKNLADESWDIDYRNITDIAEKCEKHKIDGVIAGYSEFRVMAACRIANALKKPFYCSLSQIELTRNKRLFKDECKKYGIKIPLDYYYDDSFNPKNIKFPVIVKPTDYAGRKGITIVEKPQDLSKAIDYALSLSESKTIIIEEYIVGVEFTAIYCMSNGLISFSCLNKKYLNNDQKRKTGLCDLAVAPSPSLDYYVKNVDRKVKAFLKGIGAKNGVAFFQGIQKGKEFYIFEMGYRLNGGNDYFLIEQERNISYMKMLISYSLTGSMGDDLTKNNPYFENYHSNYIIYCHEGVVNTFDLPTAGQIDGIDQIQNCLFKGRKMVEDGSTGQRAYSFKLTNKTLDELKNTIANINSICFAKDINDKELLFSKFDVSRIK